MTKRTYHHNQPKKDRKINETDRAFYKLGFQDGEHQLKHTLVLLKTTNRRLWDEICRLDEIDPIDIYNQFHAKITGVSVPEPMIQQVIKALRKPIKNYYLPKQLQRLLKK